MRKLKYIIMALGVVPAMICMVGLSLAADYPQWWYDKGVVEQGAAVNDYAAANAGQLKWFAKQAAAHFDDYLPGGAGQSITDMIAGWSQADNYNAINLGQIKAVAKPFYDRLIAEGYTNTYPWTTTTNDDANYATANLGQLKNVFSFDLAGGQPDLDTDGDGLPDSWEQAIVDADPNDLIRTIADVLPGADFDGDGWTNLQEFKRGGNPTGVFVPDTGNQLGLILMTPIRGAN